MPHLYQEIAETLRLQIASGELPSGARLPSVREMAEKWGCTPGTVNRAYKQLAHEGLIGGQRGGGTHVIDNVLAEHPPQLRWVELVNRAEQFLLEALGAGHSISESQAALGVAISRWRTMREKTPAETSDLALELLLQRLGQHDPQLVLEANFVGSLGGLIALARGEADIAGIHLWDAATHSYNLPYVHRLLPGQRLALLTLAQRALGLIVPPGNPQDVHGLVDITGQGVRWINRQSGSGTRVWLDEQLQVLAVDPAEIEGYEVEEATHMGVAQAVHEGRATAGLGIEAAAAAYGLHFIPLTEEIYQLVVPEATWQSLPWQTILDAVQSSGFMSAVADLGGYNIATTGQVAWA